MKIFAWMGVLFFSSFIAAAQNEMSVEINENEEPLTVHFPSELPLQLFFATEATPFSFPLTKSFISMPSLPFDLTSHINIPDFGCWQSQQIPLNNKFSVLFSKRDETYTGLGAVYIAQASVCWNVNQQLALIGGVFLNKQNTSTNPVLSINYGFHSLIQYSLTRKIELNLYGNYLDNNSGDPSSSMNFLFTQTKIGSNVTYKKDELHKVGIGIDQQYNTLSKQWQSVYGTKITYKFSGR